MRSWFLSTAVMLSAVSTLGLSLGFSAQASELDNEASVTNEQVQAAADLPATLVVRVNEATKAVEVMHSNSALPAEEGTVEAISNQPFSVVNPDAAPPSELDQDSSSSSWYFVYPYYRHSYPQYYYYGYSYSYSSYYSYYYRGYSYTYYRWSYWRY